MTHSTLQVTRVVPSPGPPPDPVAGRGANAIADLSRQKGISSRNKKAPPKQGQVVGVATCDARHRLRPLFVLPFERLEIGHSRRAFG
jgi:hypothetical protein